MKVSAAGGPNSMTNMSSLRRLSLVVLAVLMAGSFAPSEGKPACAQRLLVLSAVPSEIDKLYTQTKISSTLTTNERTFYIGRLLGNDVAMAVTGVGLINATTTVQDALGHFRCGNKAAISGIVFSGSSGGHTYIGDVLVPSRWSLDKGVHWFNVDARMLATAKAVKAQAVKKLRRDPPLGDLVCAGIDPDLITAIHFSHPPQIYVGGNGASADPFGGRAFPCTPKGSDVFGCQPCRAQPQPTDVVRFATSAIPFVDPNFFFGYGGYATPPGVAAIDMETAGVGRIATRNKIPFIAFRSISDGAKGDPYNIPDAPIPLQYFAYQQIAGDNAATMALAFLQAWGARR
jgi:nucleoside phosphorylase